MEVAVTEQSLKHRIIRQWLTAFRVRILLSQLEIIDEEHNSHDIRYSNSIVPCLGATMTPARVSNPLLILKFLSKNKLRNSIM